MGWEGGQTVFNRVPREIRQQENPEAAGRADHHRLRQASGMSQAMLANRSQRHRSYITRIERGTENPTITVLQEIAGALAVPLAALIEDVSETGRLQSARPRVGQTSRLMSDSVHVLKAIPVLLGSNIIKNSDINGLSDILGRAKVTEIECKKNSERDDILPNNLPNF